MTPAKDMWGVGWLLLQLPVLLLGYRGQKHSRLIGRSLRQVPTLHSVFCKVVAGDEEPMGRGPASLPPQGVCEETGVSHGAARKSSRILMDALRGHPPWQFSKLGP